MQKKIQTKNEFTNPIFTKKNITKNKEENELKTLLVTSFRQKRKKSKTKVIHSF